MQTAGFSVPVPMSNVVPKLSRTPGAIGHAGPRLGEHTDAILRALGGCDDADLAALREASVIE